MSSTYQTYIEQLTEDEKKVLNIGKQILGDSLCIHKCNDYISYLKRLQSCKCSTRGTKS